MKLLRLITPSDEGLLRSAKVASPCHESWEEMPGGDSVRSCDRCQQKVYNLSEMTAAEAAKLVREAEGRLCVRFYRRADGTMLTRDCPVGAQAKRTRRMKQVAAFSGVTAAAAGVGLYRAQHAPNTVSTVQVETGHVAIMGDIAEPVQEATMGKVAVMESRMGQAMLPAAEMGEARVDKSFMNQNLDQVSVDARQDPFEGEHGKKAQPESAKPRPNAK